MTELEINQRIEAFKAEAASKGFEGFPIQAKRIKDQFGNVVDVRIRMVVY